MQWLSFAFFSRSWWWTGRPGVLRFMGSQRVGHDWATELNWTELNGYWYLISLYVLICIYISSSKHRRIDAFELWCWRKLLSPLDCKEIQPVHPKGDHSWILIGRTDAEAETPILWPPDAKSWLTGKDPDAGKEWTQEEKGTTEDEIVGWHHRLNGHEFE